MGLTKNPYLCCVVQNLSRSDHNAIVDGIKNAKKGENLAFRVGNREGVIEITGKEEKLAVEYLKRCSEFR